ncbi:MAG: thioredoxin family protein [Phycisphaerales bacterium JB040]
MTNDSQTGSVASKARPAGVWFGFVVVAVLVVIAGSKVLQSRPAETPGVLATAGLTLADATAQGEASGKPVLAFVTAAWCGPCQSLKRNGLADERVQALIGERTVGVTLEETTEQGKRDMRGLPVRAYPTLVLLRDGEVVSMMEGAQPASAIVSWLESNTAPAGEG